MPSSVQFDSFDQAYAAVLRHVRENHQFVNAPRGNASRELIGASFQLKDPTARQPFIAARKTNPIYNFAEVLWYLAGRQDVGMMAHYAPVRRAGTPKGVPADESAYGPRIFRAGPDGGPSNFSKVIDLLRSEIDSKRGVLPVFAAADLDDPDAPSVPCLVGLHLLLREGRLHMVVYMRANDADRGLLADVFSFTFIQEFAARLLGVELGTYTHHVGSLHIAEADLPRVNRVLAETRVAARPAFGMPAMPPGTSWHDIDRLLEIEEALRLNNASLEPATIAPLGLDPYWQQVVLLLEAYRQITFTADPIDPDLVRALYPGYRWLVEHRWPTRVSIEAHQ